MRQLLLPGDRAGDRRFVLDEKTSRYLLRVLRLGKGEGFPAIDEAGHKFLCTIEDDALPAVRIAVFPDRESGGEALGMPRIALVQALPKGPKMDIIIRQAVEAGATAVFPLQTRNCVVRELDGKDGSSRLERRRKIIREALQQSGSAIRTRMLPVSSVDSLAANLSAEGFSPESSLCLMFHELPLAEKSLHEYCAGETRPVVILIGPEGGFAPDETGIFLDKGFKPVHFGGSILRTETAALYAIAAVRTILMERSAWTLSK